MSLLDSNRAFLIEILKSIRKNAKKRNVKRE